MVGVAREQVAAARAAVREQALAGREPALDLGAVGRPGAGDQPCRLLLDPAEGGDVVVRAEQDPRLARARLRGEVGLPLEQPVRALGRPAREHGRVAVAHRPLQDGQRQAVDLEEDDAGGVGLDAVVRALRDALDHAQRVDLAAVHAEDGLEHDRDGGGDERHQERPAEARDVDRRGVEVRGGDQDQRVEHEHEQEVDDQRVGQAQRRHERRQHGRQRADEERDDEGVAEVRDRDVRDERRCDEQ